MRVEPARSAEMSATACCCEAVRVKGSAAISRSRMVPSPGLGRPGSRFMWPRRSCSASWPANSSS